MLSVGIDVGVENTKVAIVEDGKVLLLRLLKNPLFARGFVSEGINLSALGRGLSQRSLLTSVATGFDQRESAKRAIEQALQKAGKAMKDIGELKLPA